MTLKGTVKYLIEYLVYCLDELNEDEVLSQFCEGEKLAFAECLEIISRWKGFDKYGITDIEKRFNMK